MGLGEGAAGGGGVGSGLAGCADLRAVAGNACFACMCSGFGNALAFFSTRHSLPSSLLSPPWVPLGLQQVHPQHAPAKRKSHSDKAWLASDDIGKHHI